MSAPWGGLHRPSRLTTRNADDDILYHSDVLMWADGRETSLRPLLLAQGFELVEVVEGEFSEESIGSRVCSAARELRDWNPRAPGEGWRLVWLGETEDGLAAWFALPLAIAAAKTLTEASAPILIPRQQRCATFSGAPTYGAVRGRTGRGH